MPPFTIELTGLTSSATKMGQFSQRQTGGSSSINAILKRTSNDLEWPSHCCPATANGSQKYAKENKVPGEIALTIIVPFCIVGILLVALAAVSRIKDWRKRRRIEEGFKEFMRQVRG